MSYIDKETQEYPISESQIRERHPLVNFPTPFKPPKKYAPVFISPLPEFNSLTQKVVEGKPIFSDKGDYEQKWLVKALPKELAKRNLQKASDELNTYIHHRVEKRLNDFAKSVGYGDINSISKYQNLSQEQISSLPEGDAIVVSRYKRECDAIALLVAFTWAKFEMITKQVSDGTRSKLLSFEDIEAELPALELSI